MFVVGKTIVTDDIADKQFLCDRPKCKAQCCVIGDSGAPLEENERAILHKIFKKVRPYINAAEK